MVRLFVPINYSDYSVNAVNYAIKLGQKIPSTITLITCKDPIISKEESGNKELKLDEFKKAIEAGFNEQQKQNINLSSRIVTGYPEDILVEISIQEEPDAIIMGTRSKGETIKELLGSITSDVIKNAKVPVLAVPANSTVDTDKLSNILFVTDFGDNDYRSLHKLIRLITPFQTHIFATHFKAAQPDKWDKKRLEEMRLYCKQTYRNYNISFDFITGDDFISALDTFIESNQIDLIAMTRHKRNMISKILHPSITRKILFHTDIPLLVFHE
ncbi:universal stress protein [Carboxylicivirga sp. A043]|uniref:universal stress protein n=1 Tax=Carboxylicivirga litoralis TaxID=2816963 RepID=UPI0021CB19E6|nr:universal stress protein [Carboxylicivirga sp. A043]MCU4156675.1 universal stress protein [Carboxylicivirga sp. A043]